MKKILSFVTGSLFVAALFVNVSYDSNGHARLIQTSSAVGQLWQIEEVNCYVNGIPNGHGYGCFNGTLTSCTPINCPGM